ncbi:MAG TPA: DUF423 domain-containing protein [Kofleriaceae bacterium]|nr:DUF423 domain-containing protein [Kofleriaceae bacterium]
MIRSLIALGAINGGIAVAAGAFGAHGLKERISQHSLEIFETAVRYQMFHALAMILCAVIATSGARTAGWLFQAGIVVFSGSLYLLALTETKWLGAVTPVGGLAFLAGWAALAWSALR